VIPHLSEQHHIEPILSASAMSPVVGPGLDFQSWAPPEKSQPIPPESQPVQEKNARCSFSATPQGPGQVRQDSQSYPPYGQNQTDTAPSLPFTSPVVERSFDFQSWVPPATSSQAPPEPQSVQEKNARYSVSSISQGPRPDSQSYLAYKPSEDLTQTYRNVRSQSVPMFPWKE
jgi:hypothetical protein